MASAPLTPWPRLREVWWVYLLAAGLIGLHAVAVVARVRCLQGTCGGPVGRAFDPDAVGGVPRLVTTALLVATAVLAVRAARSAAGRTATWWGAVAGIGGLLALAKLVSAHSVAKSDAAVLTLLGSALLAAVALGVLWRLGRRWAVPGTGPVVTALGLYAVAALGLDAATTVLSSVQDHAGALSEAGAVFVEELGEALTALAVLVTVRWQTAARGTAVLAGDGSRVRAQPARQQ